MWKAIIANKEDDFYYLLKTFAESLESDLLKAAKPKDEDAVVLLIRLMTSSKEELNSYMKGKLKPLNVELNKLTEENKKLNKELNSAQKRKEIDLESNDKLMAELRDLNMKLRLDKKSGKERRPLTEKQKKAITQRAKELRAEISEISAKNRDKVSLENKEINEKVKEITDKIKINDEKRKQIKSQIEESKVNYKQGQRETALRNYMKSPTEENLNVFQSLFFSTRQLLNVKDSETGTRETKIENKSPLQFNKTQLDADLKTLGWDGTGKTAKEVLNNIKTRKEVTSQSKKFSILDLTGNVTNASYVRELKSLVKDNKPLLDSLTEANRLLVFEGDSREYFRNVLDTKRSPASKGKKGKSNIKNKFDRIHSQHRGAIDRIVSVLQKIVESNQVNTKEAKLAHKLSKKLISAVQELKFFEVYEIENWEKKKIKPIGEKKPNSDNLFNTTLEVYEDILNDLNLSQSQEKDLAELGEEGKVYEEVEQKLDDFVTKLKANKNLQMITIDAINAIMGLSDASLSRFATTRAYDKDYNIYYEQTFSKEKENALIEAVKEIKEELNNDMGENSRQYDKYYEKINEILESAGFVDSRLTRGRVSRKKLSEALSDSEYTDDARKYLSKNLLPLLEKLNQQGTEEDADSKVLDNTSFNNLVNYIENPNKETFYGEDMEENERYLSRLLMSTPNTKLGKKINRVFKNQQTRKYLDILGLLGGSIQEKPKEAKE